MRLLIVVLSCVVLASLAGCSHFGSHSGAFDLVNQARGPEQNRKLHTDLIKAMIKQHKLYAALAHIQSQKKKYGGRAQLELLRADVLRKLDKTHEAETIYRKLLSTRFRGYAEHGLGLVYARDNIARAMPFLQRAVRLRPTDARFRNDLGYALMKQGEFDQAEIQLATAFQLDDNAHLSRNNYVELLLIKGDESAARHVASGNGIDTKTFNKLQKQAQQLKKRVARKGIHALQLSTTQTPAPPVVGGGGG